MYNENDEMYEVDDFDADIQRKQALLAEAKSIDMDSDKDDVGRKVNDLKRKWKRIGYWESEYEEQLLEEFEAILDVYFSKRKANFQSNEAMKEDLIAQAKVLSKTSEWNQGVRGMNDLMAQWKEVGSCGKEKDDALWDLFNKERQVFYDRKRENWENLQVKFSNAREVKQNLIKEAAALATSSDWQSTSEKYRLFMKQWKDAGSAGKEYEDTLWNDFNDVRQAFYTRRDEYYESLRDEQAKYYEQKDALLQKARAIVETKEFTKEQTAQMKALSIEWKTIGNCGKDKEDKVWKEFRFVMDAYFNGLREFNEQKHAQWRQRMLDVRKHKLELLLKQKQQITYLQREATTLLGQRAVDEMMEEIKDKEEFIAELEEQIADIDKTLEQK